MFFDEKDAHEEVEDEVRKEGDDSPLEEVEQEVDVVSVVSHRPSPRRGTKDVILEVASWGPGLFGFFSESKRRRSWDAPRGGSGRLVHEV